MGICLSKKSTRRTRFNSNRIAHQSSTTSINRWSRFRSSSVNSDNFDDAVIRGQAIAAALLYQQHQQNGDVLNFDRSVSVRRHSGRPKSLQSVSRSPSTQRRNSLIDPTQFSFSYQELNHDELETSHIVLVHGGGFGAWCWYKTIALLQECKFKVTAIDLSGCGIDLVDPNSIKSLSHYVKPLTDFLEHLTDGEKVILAGHDFGGACISYAMELYPTKVAKAIFIAASMVKTGQSTLDMFFNKENTNDLMRHAQKFLYANGHNQPPTAIDLDKSLLKDLLFNQSSPKDVALALVSMRPIPFSPVLEKLSLSKSNYGSIRRFYIETAEDNAIPIALQQIMIDESPPVKVFRLKGADHCPFFSKPQALHKLLVEIAKINKTEQLLPDSKDDF
ncbi:putative methylesterase 11, chloroplastic [Rutidosis leptorrhynchoides]|uniref:putative methylesterase 11, chloroplastic n=1 Tax=Rutidosis leptorrhynchoides TaxID=125765 RepID=UPI003A993F47